MGRIRDPKRDEAFKLWQENNGKLDLVEIAAKLEVSSGTVRGWKSKDRWDDQNVGTLQSTERNAPKNTERSKRKPGAGAPPGNRNALGNRGGPGGPPGNSKAVKHGFFQKHLPPETLELIGEIETRSPIDILWDNITIQYAAIIRAQQIMFVQDRDDMTKVLKRDKQSDTMSDQEWELQHAWDKQATFLSAQSRAMSTLQGMIAKYEDLCRQGAADEEQQLRIEKLKAEVTKIKGDDGPTQDDGFVDALRGKVSEVWDDDGSTEA